MSDRVGFGPPTVSLHVGHVVSTVQMCCLRPVFLPSSLLPLTGPGSGRPQCHGTRCRLCRCAASGPSSLPSLNGPDLGRPQCHRTRCRLCRCAASGPSSLLAAHSVTARVVDCAGVLPPAPGPSSLLSLTGPRGWPGVAYKCRDCWSLASGPLFPCPPPRPGRRHRHADSDGYEPGRMFSKETPTRTRPGPRVALFCLCTTSVHILFQLVNHFSAAWFYLIFLFCFTSPLCHRRFLKPVAGPWQ